MKNSDWQNSENFGQSLGAEAVFRSVHCDVQTGRDELPEAEPDAVAAASAAFEREQMERWQERAQEAGH